MSHNKLYTLYLRRGLEELCEAATRLEAQKHATLPNTFWDIRYLAMFIWLLMSSRLNSHLETSPQKDTKSERKKRRPSETGSFIAPKGLVVGWFCQVEKFLSPIPQFQQNNIALFPVLRNLAADSSGDCAQMHELHFIGASRSSSKTCNCTYKQTWGVEV